MNQRLPVDLRRNRPTKGSLTTNCRSFVIFQVLLMKSKNYCFRFHAKFHEKPQIFREEFSKRRQCCKRTAICSKRTLGDIHQIICEPEPTGPLGWDMVDSICKLLILCN